MQKRAVMAFCPGREWGWKTHNPGLPELRDPDGESFFCNPNVLSGRTGGPSGCSPGHGARPAYFLFQFVRLAHLGTPGWMCPDPKPSNFSPPPPMGGEAVK